MKKPDLPDNEPERLKILRGIKVLDTKAEERFDRVTRMAKHLFDVPIALVSLVDENRQWFKSCIGLDVRETSRDVSFCGHAILGGDIFMIPDTREDNRFADNPLVTGEPYIRFYAGCPLKLNGHQLGTLCIIDHEPRHLDEKDLQVFRDLAEMVEHEISALDMATHDELTGLSNRRGLKLLATQALRFSERESYPLSLIFIDLNGFKQINDQLGHAEGDKVLVDFSRLLQASFRESDLVARLGGDEFVVLLHHADMDKAETAMEKLKQALDAHEDITTLPEPLSYSYGIVTHDSQSHDEIEALLKAGDELMYANKRTAG